MPQNADIERWNEDKNLMNPTIFIPWLRFNKTNIRLFNSQKGGIQVVWDVAQILNEVAAKK